MSDATPTNNDYHAVLTFRLAQQYYAIDIDNVTEVAAMVASTQIADAHPALIGIANRHGNPLPLLDLRIAFDLPASALSVQTLFIVVDTGEDYAGLVVDEIMQVMYTSAEQVQPSSGQSRIVTHIISDGNRIYQLIDLEQVTAKYIGS